MKTRTLFLGLMAVILTWLAPGLLTAQPADLKSTAKMLLEAVGDGKAAELIKEVNTLKAAGLSYQPGLLAPREGAVECKDRRDQLQVLLGIYTVDVTYAFYFGKAAEAEAIHAFTRAEVLNRLAVKPKLKGSYLEPDFEKRFFAEGPVDQATIDAEFAEVQAGFEKLLKMAQRDPDILDFMVDRLFGDALETMYLSCQLSLGAPGGEKLVPVFNTVSARIDLVLPALEALKEPALQASLMRTERVMFLNAVRNIIQKKGGNLDAGDLKGILALVEPIRNMYVAKCK